MVVTFLAACTLAALTQGAKPAESQPLPGLIRSVPLAGVRGRIDHMAFDESTGRLFIAAIGNGSLEVVDVAKAEGVRSIADLPEPQGVICTGHRGSAVPCVVVTCGGDGSARVLDSDTLRPMRTITLSPDADNVRESGSDVYIGCGEGDSSCIARISITSESSMRSSATRWPLRGHPEAFSLLSMPDPKEDRPGARPGAHVSTILVNVPSAREVAAIDLKTGAAQHWALKSASANYPMAAWQEGPRDQEPPTARVIVGCRQPPMLLLLDAADGKELAAAPCAHDVDDLVLAADHTRLYAVCGGDGGVIDCFAVTPGSLAPIGRITTAPGARTGIDISLPDHRWALAIAAPAHDNEPAALRIYAPAQESR